jgi:hypothetical protein
MADITVQVSSAGLTAYGASDWGSQTYGGDQSTSTTLGSADAFNNEGWGRLSWNSLVWGQDFEDITIQVTTPGKGTLWGDDVWGDAEWGQITGIDTDLGSADLTVSVDASITGEQLNTTTNTAVAGASALVTPNSPSPIANTSVNNVFGGETNVVQVTSPSNDEWGTEPYGQGFWGVGDGITIFVGTETEHIADGNVEVTGNQIDFQAVGTVEIPVIIENGFELQSAQGNAFGGELVEVQVSTASAVPWGYAPYGEGEWGQGVGTDIGIGGEEVAVPSVEVPVNNTNLTINSFANNQPTITADANTLQTGEELTIVLGNEDAVPNTKASVTGIQIGPFVIGDYQPGINGEAFPTGVTATTSTGIIGLNAWAVVDPGTAPTWTVVDIAA